MKRLTDWRGRLAAAVNAMMREPFRWGSNDCVSGLFAPVVRAVTGTDLSGELPEYDTLPGAKDALADRGFDGLRALALTYLEEIAPAFARAGDIVIIENQIGGIGEGFGVVIGERIGVLTEAGYGTVSRETALSAYRVGQ
jgi:hypothetical protein